MNEWYNVHYAWPNPGVVVLVRLADGTIAMGCYNITERVWMVQPFGTAWYATKHMVAEWRLIDD